MTWQAHFNHLDAANVEEIAPPKQVWDNIESRLFNSSERRLEEKIPWYQMPYIWLSMGLSSAVTAALAIMLLLPISEPSKLTTTPTIGYLAVMSAADTQLNDADIGFVLAAYKSDQPGQSTLQVQWNSEFSKVDTSDWVLTSVARESGAITDLGLMKSVLNRHLTSIEWKAIKGSEFLQIKKGDQIIFEGPCLQLTEWGKKEAS